MADAAPDAGLGHVGRSTAVAAGLAARGVETLCRGHEAPSAFARDGVEWLPLGESAGPAPEAVLLDSYRLDGEAVGRLTQGAPLAAMHDFGEPPPGAALVVSPAAEEGPGRLAGFRYACLRADFWGLPRREPRASLERVLVTTGASDPGGHAFALAGAVGRTLPEVALEVVVGQADPRSAEGVEVLHAPESLLEPLCRADLVVSAAGQTMLEAAAAGTPCVSLPLYENQRSAAAALAAAGAARVVDPPNVEAAAEAVRALAEDHSARADLSEQGQAAVDGFGALRVAFHVARLAEKGSP